MKSSPQGGGWATHAALLLVQFAFASQAVEAKIAMLPRREGGEEIFPEALAMARMLGGALFFQALAHLWSRTGRPRNAQIVPLARTEHAKLFGLSVLGISLNQALFLFGLRWTTPFAVSLLGATIPVFAASLSVLFRKEAFAWRTVLGLLLALVGVLSLSGLGHVDHGAILVAMNSLSYAAYVVLSRETVLKIGALRLMAWVFTYGALAFAPLGLAACVASMPQWSTRAWVLVAYIVVVPTMLAYYLNAWALTRTSATVVTIYIYLQPLLAGLLAHVQLGHTISSRAGIAAAFILLGLGVVTSRTVLVPRRHRRA